MDGTTNAQPNDGARASGGAPADVAESSDLAARIAQLEQRLNTTSEGTGRQDQSTGWQVQDWISIATLIALVIYGSARFGDAAFYARLGTDPDAVGLNYGVTLSRVATTIAVTGAGVMACLLYGRLYKETSNTRGKYAGLSFAMIVGGILLGTLTVFLILLILPTELGFIIFRGAIAVLLVVFLFWVGYMFEAPKRGSHKSHIYLTIALATVVLFALSGVAGYNSAGYVMRGQVLPCPCFHLDKRNITVPWSTGSSGFLGLEADYAQITWVGPEERVVPTSAIFLGSSNGDVVLFDYKKHRLLVVPSSDVIVHTEGSLIGWNE